MDTPVVTVKLFAALRDAAGTGEVTVDAPTTLPTLLDELSQRFGQRFADRLRVAAVMVDGTPTDPESERTVTAGAEVALLPPFAGG